MPYQVQFWPSASREMKKLSGDIQRRLLTRIESLSIEPRPPGCSKLTGMDAYRIRVGDYRVVYEIHDSVLVVLVIRIAHRREVYDQP